MNEKTSEPIEPGYSENVGLGSSLGRIGSPAKSSAPSSRHIAARLDEDSEDEAYELSDGDRTSSDDPIPLDRLIR